MDKYFKTQKDSKTGKKFAEIQQKMKDSYNASRELAIEYGFTKWTHAFFYAYGGISKCFFSDPPNMKIWRKEENGYYPRANTKKGKEIIKKFDELPAISHEELNAAIGWDEGIQTIGFNPGNNSNYYGFITESSWKINIPADCTEITETEYSNLNHENS